MTAFVVVATVLAVLVVGLVFAPLLRTRPAVGATLAVAALLTVGGLYVLVGTPAALDPVVRRAPETLDQAIAALERQLAADPRQPEGWRLLAEAYAAEGRRQDAVKAYERALPLDPGNPDMLVQAAEARALASPDHRFDARAVAMLHEALAAAPDHQRARWFLGVAQRQAGQAAEAARTWEPLLAAVDPAAAAALRPQVDAARQDAGLPPLPAQAVDRSKAITLAVDLAPGVRERLPAGAVVFVIARQPGGPPMPVAAKRVPVADLPATITLTDADSPMPTLRLSQVGEVEVVARASASGDANAQAGDAESAPVRMRVGGQASLTIEQPGD